MAKKDAVSTTEEFACTKEVDCQWCSTKFQFPMKTPVAGSGPTMTAAKRDALKKATQELEDDPGQERCPACGALQVCMEASSHALGHGCAMWLAGIFLVLSIGAGFLIREKLVSFLTMPMISWLLLVICLMAVVYNVFVVRRNPNQDLEQGRTEAQEKVARQKITVISKGQGPLPDSIPKSLSTVQIFAVALSLIGVALIPAAEWLRIVSGWPMNHASVPPVAGPGDEVTLFWPQTIECMKGHWRGTAKVDLLDAGPNGQRTAIAATCSTEDWGNFIGGKGAKKRDTAIWTKIQLPDDQTLTGKSVQLDARISVVYPKSTGLIGFENKQEEFANVFTFHLAPAHAAMRYEAFWWLGLIGGGVLVAVSAFVLRRTQLSIAKSSVQPRTLNVHNVNDEPRTKPKPDDEELDDLEFVDEPT